MINAQTTSLKLTTAGLQFSKEFTVKSDNSDKNFELQEILKIVCLRLTSINCDSDMIGVDITSDNKLHIILPIKQLTENLKDDLRTTMDTLNKKRQKGYNHIKQALRDLSEAESGCDKIKEEISAHAKKMASNRIPCRL